MTIEQEMDLAGNMGNIADSLERIEDSLQVIGESLEALSKCVGYVPSAPHQKEGYHIFRIGGSVDTGNY